MVDDARKVGRRSFQTRGPETAKLRDPYVIVLVLGTIRSSRAATTTVTRSSSVAERPRDASCH